MPGKLEGTCEVSDFCSAWCVAYWNTWGMILKLTDILYKPHWITFTWYQCTLITTLLDYLLWDDISLIWQWWCNNLQVLWGVLTQLIERLNAIRLLFVFVFMETSDNYVVLTKSNAKVSLSFLSCKSVIVIETWHLGLVAIVYCQRLYCQECCKVSLWVIGLTVHDLNVPSVRN